MTSQILTIHQILEGIQAKSLEVTILFVNFSKAFDSKHRRKMEQIQLAYGLPKETVTAIMILYKNTKVKVHSLDGDTDYFDIVAGVLQGDTLAPYLFIICVDYVLRISVDIMKDNGFKLAKERSRGYPAQTTTDADQANDIAFLANTPAQAKTLLHGLEQAAGGIGLHVHVDKTEHMCFNQRGDISTTNSSPLKLMDKFTYLRSNRERHQHMTSKAWTAINRLLVIWKSELTNKIKRSCVNTAIWMHYMDTNWTYGGKAW